MTRLFIRTSIALLTIAATTASVAAPAPALVQAWGVDHGRSRLGFVAAMNGQAFNGLFRRWEAKIRFDPAHLDASSVQVLIDAGSATTGDQTRDEALPTADWFAAQSFPRATFVSRHFVSLGGNRYRVDGDLKIRDTARPVSIPFQLQIQGPEARMAGRLSIDRTLFGVGQGQFKGTDTVAAKVDVVINLSASKLP